MNNELEIISKSTLLGKEIDVYGTVENPLFKAKDVANWIEHTNLTMMVNGVDEDEKVTRRTKDSLGRENMATFLTENGLYEVLMLSHKPIAKQFKKGIKQILHDIRTKGGYLTPQKIDEILSDPDTIIKLATTLKDERAKRMQAEKQLEEQHPKIVFADAVVGSSTSILVGELAKMISQNGYEIGQNRLFKWLRDNNYLCKYGERRNIPYQQFIEQGLFTLKTNTFSVNGEMKTKNTVKVTQKGCMYFINKFIKK